MTLSTRNRLLIAAFVSTVPVLAGLAFAFPEAIGAASAALAASSRRSAGFGTFIGSLVAPASAWATMIAIMLSVLYASAALALLYYSFEKTQAPEVLFFAAFSLSFAVEGFRIAVPLVQAREWPPAFIVGAARAIAFGRFFGILSLFAASVYANGIDFQKHGRIFIIIAAAALTISTGIPVDGLSYDSAFSPLSGYRPMIELVEATLALIAIASFIVAAYVRGAREFSVAGAGIALAFLGRDFLLKGDSWLTLPLGIALLGAGTWLFIAKIHRYYLWL